LLRRAVSAVIALAEKKKITIKRPKVDELLYLSADDDRLSRVLINLLGNALKFSPNNTTITIGVKELMEVIEFTVSDEGRGIPADHVARIFDRFQQVTADDARVLGGSGLGLAITKAIIEEHGGTIIVVSDVDKGTTFTFRIPKKKPQAVARKS
jgi:signal transduction histidine kinase